VTQSRVVVTGALGECVHFTGAMDFLRLAEMYVDTIEIAWAAAVHGVEPKERHRSPGNLATSIRLHQALMAWYSAGISRSSSTSHTTGAGEIRRTWSLWLPPVSSPAGPSRTPWPALRTCGLIRASSSARTNGLPRRRSRSMRSAGWARGMSPIPSPILQRWRAATSGILDAPHLCNNYFARGQIITRIDRRGACVAMDVMGGRPLPEAERLAFFL
jgi:hypothetical protein